MAVLHLVLDELSELKDRITEMMESNRKDRQRYRQMSLALESDHHRDVTSASRSPVSIFLDACNI